MTPATYSAEFAGGYRATLTITPAGMRIDWHPRIPRFTGDAFTRFVAAYRTWRDECLADYARRTGRTVTVVEV